METIEVLPIRVRITAILRKALLSGEFAPGEELSLSETAARLGVSRTPVREAFQSLASEGLLELRMNRGAIVIGVDEKFIRDHFEVRRLLESEALAGAIHARPPLEELEALQCWAEEHRGTMTAEEYSAYNQRFHMAIWDADGNKRLKALLLSLWNGPSAGKAGRDTAHEEISIREHRQMLECIRRGDVPGGRETMELHIRRSMENILRSYQTARKEKEKTGEQKC
ncbi:GntR family transcriptional regulator [Pseudoflavonifractor sp. MSJ-30]|uniref:GntR family transcriptional regulator n=1 Tax=Pseudoflavonifractor sp. MSJ-30 TaxID=2841525 RepID=UPI001C107F22|nr:GntR family transcriptional regulator [Pseudoflavonifractor sp. MSJ-30]MBU5452452.1 GntR family transcriptional regulator [Pseudoflavonifractor sp. MSJ-30]